MWNVDIYLHLLVDIKNNLRHLLSLTFSFLYFAQGAPKESQHDVNIQQTNMHQDDLIV